MLKVKGSEQTGKLNGYVEKKKEEEEEDEDEDEDEEERKALR